MMGAPFWTEFKTRLSGVCVGSMFEPTQKLPFPTSASLNGAGCFREPVVEGRAAWEHSFKLTLTSVYPQHDGQAASWCEVIHSIWPGTRDVEIQTVLGGGPLCGILESERCVPLAELLRAGITRRSGIDDELICRRHVAFRWFEAVLATCV